MAIASGVRDAAHDPGLRVRRTGRGSFYWYSSVTNEDRVVTQTTTVRRYLLGMFLRLFTGVSVAGKGKQLRGFDESNQPHKYLVELRKKFRWFL